MLLKTNNRDADKQAEVLRRDVRVHQAIDRYRRFLRALNKPETDIALTTHFTLLERSDTELDEVIRRIAEVYQEVTGRSPRTTDVLEGKHPFSALIIDLFKQEKLRPPSRYAVKKAIKTGRRYGPRWWRKRKANKLKS
jgi:hypothetical protein